MTINGISGLTVAKKYHKGKGKEVFIAVEHGVAAWEVPIAKTVPSGWGDWYCVGKNQWFKSRQGEIAAPMSEYDQFNVGTFYYVVADPDRELRSVIFLDNGDVDYP